MKSNSCVAAAAIAASLALAHPAFAQTSRGQHHPGGAAAPCTTMPPGRMVPGLPESRTPGSPKPGPGAMGLGKMGSGDMGRMMQSGMMGGDCPMTGMMMGQGSGMPHANARMAFLKTELKITEAQQATLPAERLKARVSAMGSRPSLEMGNGGGLGRALKPLSGDGRRDRSSGVMFVRHKGED